MQCGITEVQLSLEGGGIKLLYKWLHIGAFIYRTSKVILGS